MEFIFEVILQFLGEMLLQIAVEVLAEIGLQRVKNSRRHPRHPVVSAIGYILMGAAAGGISLLVLPHGFISDPLYRQLNLIVTPVAAGMVMVLIGRRRQAFGEAAVRLDRFGYAFIFAFVMAGVRFIWAS